MANSNATTIIGYAYNLLKTDGDTVSTPGLQQAMMLTMLSQANMEWARTFTRGGGEPPNLFKREKGYELIPATTLSAIQLADAVTASLTDSTTFPPSGAIVVYSEGMTDIEEYTGNAANVLTGVTGADFDHAALDRVAKLYPLPANFGSFRSEDDSPDGVKVNGVPYSVTSSTPTATRFAVYDNGTTKYLWFPLDVTGDAQISYNKVSTTIDSIDDVVDVPQAYEFFLVHRLEEYGRTVRGDNVDKVEYARAKADRILLQAQKEKNIRSHINVMPIRPRRTDLFDGFTTDRDV